MLPRVVVVHRSTAYEDLLATHGTAGQAAFFLRGRGQELAPVEAEHQTQVRALETVLRAIPPRWRRVQLHRAELDRFLFEPEDVVVAVGQDGLVANVARFLDGQAVVGVNPDPRAYDGVLVRHPPPAAERLLRAAVEQRARVQPRTMVEARLGDGQRLRALNEIYIGHQSHQSARYQLRWGGQGERHSSSGLIVATGTGATGWARSITRERAAVLPLPAPEDRALVFLAREAFPSVATGTALTQGAVTVEAPLQVQSEMNTGGTVFGDGMEQDHLRLPWGETVVVQPAEAVLRLVVG